MEHCHAQVGHKGKGFKVTALKKFPFQNYDIILYGADQKKVDLSQCDREDDPDEHILNNHGSIEDFC
jgi:hypothetical protein